MSDQPEKTLSERVFELEARLGRAVTTGTSKGITVKASGRGAVSVSIDESYGLSEKKRQALAKDLEAALEQALDKQRRRVAKESSALLNS
jgi:hypothetical protein